MTEWIECKISDIGTVVGGATPSTKKTENYDGGHIAWITPKDLSSFSGRYIQRGERNITESGLKSCSAQLLPKNTVLFSSRAPIGYVAIAANKVCTNQGFKSVIPNENTEAGMRAKVKLAEYGLNGIRYKNGEADFSRCSEATVVIDHMRSNRDDNFDQADVKCAEKWNLESREGRNDWTARDVYEWRHKNKYSWHERCDTKSMDLVSRDIHNSTFSHSGGVSECKVKEGSNNGGEFDD